MSRLTGTVSIRTVASGSKSEQPSVVLTAEDRSWILRRAGGPTFGVDPELARLAGRTVTVEGVSGSGVFVVTELVAESPS